MQSNESSHVRNNELKPVTNIDKLQLLIWKNFLIQFRHYIKTTFEVVLFPFFMSPLFVVGMPKQENSSNEEYFRKLETMGIMVGVLIVLSFVFPTINTVRYIAIEKERQLKEAMKIMGLPSWLHWTSWFIRIMVFMIIAMAIIVAMLKVIEFIFFIFHDSFFYLIKLRYL